MLELLRLLVSLLLAWSYEGTFRAEEIVARTAGRYDSEAQVAVGADSAVLTAGDRTASFSGTPAVPPLDEVSDLEALLGEIDDGGLTAREATERLDALRRRPPRLSKAWQVVGLGLFATGFGISVQATRRSSHRRSSGCSSGSSPSPLRAAQGHGVRGLETWFGGHPIQGFRGVGDTVALFTALAVGMPVAAAAVGPKARAPHLRR